jgi:hypothetical protein
MEREWTWRLPTGDTIVATFDLAKRTESVFLGRRLISRGDQGTRPDGHPVPIRSAAAGAYRGQGDVRAIFDADGGHCRLLVDGQPIASEPRDFSGGEPILATDDGLSSKRFTLVLLALVVALVGGVALAVESARGHARRAPEPAPPPAYEVPARPAMTIEPRRR